MGEGDGADAGGLAARQRMQSASASAAVVGAGVGDGEVGKFRRGHAGERVGRALNGDHGAQPVAQGTPDFVHFRSLLSIGLGAISRRNAHETMDKKFLRL